MKRQSTLSRFFYTIRYLKAIQIYGRIWFRLCHPRPQLYPAPPLRNMGTTPAKWVDRSSSMKGPDVFVFLNKPGKLTKDWGRDSYPKLWCYNLHYFNDINANGASDRQAWHKSLISNWIKENPPGIGIGWESYPLSLRAVNWIKWSLSGNILAPEWINSLAVQVRWLSKKLEWHLLGNHLIANAKALVFAGAFFDGIEAKKWMQKGMAILTRQIPEQVLPDGGQFERSPMYHALALEDICDLINVLNVFPDSVPETYREFVKSCHVTVDRMVRWLQLMCHPDGEIVLFNDAAMEIAPRPNALFAYLERINHGEGANYSHPNNATSIKSDECKKKLQVSHLADSGYIRIESPVAVAFLDTARIGPDYLPAHAHADTLTFELSLFGLRFIVDSGTSCYGSSNERLHQRSTPAHNTVTINGENSSEVWAGFRVARRAYPKGLSIDEAPDRVKVACSHDGYRRLTGRPIHHRIWILSATEFEIVDTVTGHQKSVQARFHLHPEVKCSLKKDSDIVLIRILDKLITIKFSGGDLRIDDTYYHPEFGRSISNKCLTVSFLNTLHTNIKWC